MSLRFAQGQALSVAKDLILAVFQAAKLEIWATKTSESYSFVGNRHCNICFDKSFFCHSEERSDEESLLSIMRFFASLRMTSCHDFCYKALSN